MSERLFCCGRGDDGELDTVARADAPGGRVDGDGDTDSGASVPRTRDADAEVSSRQDSQ